MAWFIVKFPLYSHAELVFSILNKVYTEFISLRCWPIRETKPNKLSMTSGVLGSIRAMKAMPNKFGMSPGRVQDNGSYSAYI